MKLVVGVLLVISPSGNASPQSVLQNFGYENGILADTLPPEGLLWTAWSNWYGCHNMDADKWDDYPANVEVDETDTEGWEGVFADRVDERVKQSCTTDGCVSPPYANKREFCLRSSRYLAQSVRYRECALPDGINWDGNFEYLLDSKPYKVGDDGVAVEGNALHRLRVRDLNNDEDNGVQPGPILNYGDDGLDYTEDYTNVRPPTGDPRANFDGQEFFVDYIPEDLTNSPVEFTEEVSMASQRIACDPRIETAAEICAHNGLCMDTFAASDLNVAFLRINHMLNETNIYRSNNDTDEFKLSEFEAAVPWSAFDSDEAFNEHFVNETDGEFYDAQAAADFEHIRELFIPQLKIMIELQIQRGADWKDAIPEPYLTLWYDFAICVDDCPIPLPWTSWSCHCQKGSEMNLRHSGDAHHDGDHGDDDHVHELDEHGNDWSHDNDYHSVFHGENPEDLPLCDCQKEKRFRVQMCDEKNYDADCDPDDTRNCLNCGIYHEPLEIGISVADGIDTRSYNEREECQNYGWNWGYNYEDDMSYEGTWGNPYYTRLSAFGRMFDHARECDLPEFDDEFLGDDNVTVHLTLDDMLAPCDYDTSSWMNCDADFTNGDGEDCEWPQMLQLFPEWWHDWQEAHPIRQVYDEETDTVTFIYNKQQQITFLFQQDFDLDVSIQEGTFEEMLATQTQNFYQYYGFLKMWRGNWEEQFNVSPRQNEGFQGLYAYHAFYPFLLDRHCFFADRHPSSVPNFSAFAKHYDGTQSFAVQFDECSVTSRWTSWGAWSECSATCNSGVRSHTRDCEAFDRETGEWVINNALIGEACECEGPRTEEEVCNPQCCLQWHQCTEGTDCSFDADFEVGTAWVHAPCTGCGCPTVTAQRRCMCFDEGVSDLWLHAGFLTADMINAYPGCPADDDESSIEWGVGVYRTTKPFVCTDLPCCGAWTAWNDWSSCDVESCRDCSLPWDPRPKTRERFCGCSDDPRCPAQLEQHENDVDVDFECGGISRDVDDGVCNDVDAGEMAECCPEICCEGQALPWDQIEDFTLEGVTCPWTQCDIDCRPLMLGEDRGWDECIDNSNNTRVQDWECCRSIRNNNNEHVRFDIVANDEVYCPANLMRYESECLETPFCCEYTEWSEWDACALADPNADPISCTDDPSVKMYTTRERNPICNDIATCGDCWEIKECSIPPCAGWAEWAQWSECSCDCGKVGTQARTRSCNDAEIGSEYCPCMGDPTLYSVNAIDVNPRCDWGAVDSDTDIGFGDGYGQCQMYGYGDIWDANSADGGTHLANDPGYFQVRNCNVNPQPCSQWRRYNNNNMDSELYWSAWSHCDAECGEGVERRNRECVRVYNENGMGFIEQVDDHFCNPALLMGEYQHEERDCMIAVCPERLAPVWSEWSACSQSCEFAAFTGHYRNMFEEYGRFDVDHLPFRTRNRDCGVMLDEECEHDMHEIEVCEYRECPHWMEWEMWTPCSEPCRGREGFTKRERECSVRDLIGSLGCDGDNFEYMECNEHIECPTWSDWSAPTECYFIGDPEIGERDRRRYCMNGNFGPGCPYERRIQTSPCQVCDESITRPRVFVRRATVTLRVAMATDLEWDENFTDPNSPEFLAALAQVQAEIDARADLADGQTANVVGLSLVPNNRRRRDVEGDTVVADIEITEDCDDDAEEGNCDQTAADLADVQATLCGDAECTIAGADISPREDGDEEDDSDDAAASLISSIFLTLAVLFFL